MKEDSALQVQGAGMTASRFREATDVANVCKEIVTNTAIDIAGRRYVCVEGWTSIAVAHGCIATVKPDSVVEIRSDGKFIGIKAVGQVKRQSDGAVLAEAEGFVGDDEETWFGSHGELRKRYSKAMRKEIEVVIPKRSDYAIRSFVQTRAISKACRLAFSHVVVLMDKGLSTTPAEDVTGPDEPLEAETSQVGEHQKTDRRAEPVGNQDGPAAEKPPVTVPRDRNGDFEAQFTNGKWKKVKIHFGTNKDRTLDELSAPQIKWYSSDGNWEGGYKGKKTEDDILLRSACDVALLEIK